MGICPLARESITDLLMILKFELVRICKREVDLWGFPIAIRFNAAGYSVYCSVRHCSSYLRGLRKFEPNVNQTFVLRQECSKSSETPEWIAKMLIELLAWIPAI